ncbi:MAG: hypothetical protein Q9170_005961 [Blastenia crenularia]
MTKFDSSNKLHTHPSCLEATIGRQPSIPAAADMRIPPLFFLLSFSFIQNIFATPAPKPICLDDTYQLPAPAAIDCTNAMTNLKNDPFYATPQLFGVDENSPRNVPIEWKHKSCLLIINVEDGSKTDKFALASTMPAFGAVEKACVISNPGRGLGGYISIGHGRSFYALVQGNPDFLPSVETSGLRAGLNDSLVSPSAQESGASTPADTA